MSAEFQVGKQYRVVEPKSDDPDYGGCDVSVGDVFTCHEVDVDGNARSLDVTFRGYAHAGNLGWWVAGADYIQLGYVVPVDSTSDSQ